MPERVLVIRGHDDKTDQFIDELATLAAKANALDGLSVNIKRRPTGDGDGTGTGTGAGGHDLQFRRGGQYGDGKTQ